MAVTHELKTPLSSLSLYLESLRSEKIPADKKKDVLPKMSQDVVRLHHLVERVLEAGRFQRHDYSIAREEFELSQLVLSRINNLRRYDEQITIDLATKIPPAIRYLGDRDSLGRAIDAILDNAVKYRRGNSVTINVSLRQTNEGILLEVADNGIGLERDHLKNIFNRFYRVGSELTRRQEGTGLGLYLCREIVKAHGGNIVAHSDGTNKGSRFTMTLPK
jgi:signal transduction histidine kinase